MTKELFRNDSYLRSCQTTVRAHTEQEGIVLEETVFYPTGGGQPGDCGRLHYAGREIVITTTLKERKSGALVHMSEEGEPLPEVGAEVRAIIDWERRYMFMRMHSSLHLLCALIPFGVTGGQIGVEKGRLDFDLSTSEQPMPGKETIQAGLDHLIAEDHRISIHWVDDALLGQKPEMVRTMSVKPPTSASGLLRLVRIGVESNPIDLQPCGGTHVSSTGEIVAVRVGKIENKGARNRRINLTMSCSPVRCSPGAHQ